MPIDAVCEVLHIRCDTCERKREFTSDGRPGAKTLAWQAGWMFRKDGTTYCPHCDPPKVNALPQDDAP
jgi:hypothetical protein